MLKMKGLVLPGRTRISASSTEAARVSPSSPTANCSTKRRDSHSRASKNSICSSVAPVPPTIRAKVPDCTIAKNARGASKRLKVTRSQEDGAAATTRSSPELATGMKAGGALRSSVLGPSIPIRTRVGWVKAPNASSASKSPSLIGYSYSWAGSSPSWMPIRRVVASVPAAGLPFWPPTMRASNTKVATDSLQATADTEINPSKTTRRSTARGCVTASRRASRGAQCGPYASLRSMN